MSSVHLLQHLDVNDMVVLRHPYLISLRSAPLDLQSWILPCDICDIAQEKYACRYTYQLTKRLKLRGATHATSLSLVVVFQLMILAAEDCGPQSPKKMSLKLGKNCKYP